MHIKAKYYHTRILNNANVPSEMLKAKGKAKMGKCVQSKTNTRDNIFCLLFNGLDAWVMHA